MKKNLTTNIAEKLTTGIPFVKMQGLGNDFVIIDAREKKSLNINLLNDAAIKRIADRRFGVGCDQLLLLTNAKISTTPYLSFVIFNPDASIAQACGNGSRCVARYVIDNDLNLINFKETLLMEVEGQVIRVKKISERRFRVDMGKPKFDYDDLALTQTCNSAKMPLSEGGYKNPFGVSIGNPHAVFFSKNTDEKLLRDIKLLGAKFECHKLFKERANISFARIESPKKVTLFVWERGAGNTLACGSAACATIVAGISKGWLENNVEAKMQGGILNIEWNKNDQPVFMTGPADYSFAGKIKL